MKLLRGVLLACVLLIGACATPRRDPARSELPLPEPNDPTRLEQLAEQELGTSPQLNAFRLLPESVEALLARLMLARTAGRSLDLQYYIWRDDLTGRLLTQALLEAADRGVRIRVLLDDVGSSANDKLLLALDAHPQVEIRLFNPVSSRSFRTLGMVQDFSRINRRMHNKAFLADRKMAIVGGRNIGDEYFGASNDIAFGDLDVLTFGPVLSELQDSFQRYWDSPAAIPIEDLLNDVAGPDELEALRRDLTGFLVTQRDSPYAQLGSSILATWFSNAQTAFHRGDARVLQDDPAKISRPPGDMAGTLITQFGYSLIQPAEEVLLVSPYFVPGKAGLEWFRGLTARGIRVTVLTNSLAASDVAAVHSGYERYRKALLEAGVRLYEMRPESDPDGERKHTHMYLGSSRASLHAKTFVFDRSSVFIGSLNLDPRSVKLNTEIGLLCESPAMAEELSSGLEDELDAVAWRLELAADGNGLVWVEQTPAGELRHTREPQASSLRRFSVWLLGLLPIESLL